MKEETTRQLMLVLSALAEHTMYCRPRVVALERVLQQDPQRYDEYLKIVEDIELRRSANQDHEATLEALRKTLLQDHE